MISPDRAPFFPNRAIFPDGGSRETRRESSSRPPVLSPVLSRLLPSSPVLPSSPGKHFPRSRDLSRSFPSSGKISRAGKDPPVPFPRIARSLRVSVTHFARGCCAYLMSRAARSSCACQDIRRQNELRLPAGESRLSRRSGNPSRRREGFPDPGKGSMKSGRAIPELGAVSRKLGAN